MYKDFIYRNVSQHFLIANGLNLEEGLVFEYLLEFYEHQDFYVSKWFYDKCYFWCTPQNILNAFPILNWSETHVKKFFKRLETLKLVELLKEGSLNYFHIPLKVMTSALSDDKFFMAYTKEQCEQYELRLLDKISMLFKRGW